MYISGFATSDWYLWSSLRCRRKAILLSWCIMHESV